MLLKAVNKVGGDFKIILMPDMMAQLRRHPEYLVPAIMKIAKNPALYHLDDGRLVIAPYNAYMQSPEWWKKIIAEFKSKGVNVAFMPLFQGWWKYIDKYADISFGFSDWGCSTFDEQSSKRRNKLKTVNRHGLKFMAPVRPQDFRPKSFRGSESRNSALFREMWHTAMDSKAEWVHLITWNDYSEASEIAPSSGIRHTFYDLTAYYTTWFKTGKQPEIVRDAIYYFYRIQPVAAKVDLTKQKKKFNVIGKPCDEIELLAFMKQPGILEITIGGKNFKKEFNAGINSFTIPLSNGRPEFKLVRDGQTVIAKTGAWVISDKVVYDNLLVHGDGGTAEVVRDYCSPRKTPALKIIYGKLIKAVNKPESSTFKVSSGNIAAVKLSTMPYDRAEMVTNEKGAFALNVGPGKSRKGGKLNFGKGILLAPGEEVVFHVKQLSMLQKSGWIAVFLTIEKKGGGRLSLTLRNPTQTYISSALPKFKVERYNFPVQYPAVYRIRRSPDKLEFIYNDSVMYSYNGSDLEKFEKISILASCQKADSAVLMKISAGTALFMKQTLGQSPTRS